MTSSNLKSVDATRWVASEHPMRRASDRLPPFTVVVPCFNEVASVRSTVEMLAEVNR